jgi:hypothetical protein
MHESSQDFRYQQLEGPLVDRFTAANQTFHADGIVKIWPPGCAMFAEYRNHVDRVRRLAVREDDVWVITYPKAGECHWLFTQPDRNEYRQISGSKARSACKADNLTAM